MKKVLFMALGLMALFAFTACEKDDKDEEETAQKETVKHYWQEYPESYVRYCDHRFDFQLLKCSRVGTAVDVEFVMTNRYFNKDVKASFWMSEVAGHDNLGNAYICSLSEYQTDIIPYINGGKFNVYGHAREVLFVPNQAIRGSFTIKNFDINATMVSIACNVRCGTNGITFDHDKIEFVNMPLDEPIAIN